MIVNPGYIRLHLENQLIAFVGVEFQDTSHFDFHQLQDIIACHVTDQFRLKGFQSGIDMPDCLIHRCGLLKLPVFIDTFFDENLFQ